MRWGEGPATNYSSEIEIHESPFNEAVHFLNVKEEALNRHDPNRLCSIIVDPGETSARSKERVVEFAELAQNIEKVLEQPLELFVIDPAQVYQEIENWERAEVNQMRQFLLGNLEPRKHTWLLEAGMPAILDEFGYSSEFYRWALSNAHDREIIAQQPEAELLIQHFLDGREQYAMFATLARRHIPILLRKNLREIELAKSFPVSVKVDGQISEPGGIYVQPQKRLRGRAQIHRDFYKDDQFGMLSTLSHEVMGHGLDPRANLYGKQHLMSFTEAKTMLTEWQAIRGQTNQEVFEYPRGIVAETEADTIWLRSIEDFAETMGFYYAHPDYLWKISPDRYQFAAHWNRAILSATPEAVKLSAAGLPGEMNGRTA